MNSQLLLLLGILLPGAVVQAPPDTRSDPEAKAVAHASPAENPYAGDASASFAGRRLFERYHCAGCHGRHGDGGMGPSLRDAAWIYGDAPGELYASIAEGRRYGMPAWGRIMPSDDIWKLVAYIDSLRTAPRPHTAATPMRATPAAAPDAS